MPVSKAAAMEGMATTRAVMAAIATQTGTVVMTAMAVTATMAAMVGRAEMCVTKKK